jgi:hypothetical protein
VGSLITLLFPGLAWGAPGYAASRWLFPRSTAVERLATSLLLGLLTVVPISYTQAYVRRVPLTPLAILLVSAVATAAFIWLRRAYPGPDRPPPPGGSSIPLAVAIVCLAAAMTITTAPRDNDSASLFTPCLHESCLIMLEDGTGGGLDAYDATLDGMVTHVTARPANPGYGLSHILGHQRPGSMATMAQGVAFHGSGGLIVMMFVYDLLTLSLACALLALTLRSRILLLVLSAIFLVGSRTVAAYAVNENMLALGLGLGLLYLSLRSPDKRGMALVGWGLGLALGLRPVTATWLPALLLLAPRDRKALASLGFALGLGLLPWLVTNHQNFEQALYHPSLSIGTYEHHLLGFTFQFHPLNWPIADTLLRPDFAPLPTLLQLPLEHQRALGVVFWTLACVGLFAVRRGRALACLLFALPNITMLCLIVSLDHQKLSYGLLSLAPLPWLAGAGLDGLLRRRLSLPARLGALGLAAVWLVGVPAIAANVTPEVDTRRQYHTTGPAPGSAGVDSLQTLLTRRWIPAIPAVDERVVQDNMALLLAGRPPQRSPDEVINRPAVLWLDHDDAPIRFVAQLLPANTAAAMMRGRDNGCEPTRAFAAASLYLTNTAQQVQVDALLSRSKLTLKLTTDGSTGHSGYLALGLHNDQFAELREVSVELDGKAMPLSLLVMERESPKGERSRMLRVITNHRWHYTLVGNQPAPQPGAAADGCWTENRGGRTVSRGDGRLLLRSPGQTCRFLEVPTLQSVAPASACDDVEWPK